MGYERLIVEPKEKEAISELNTAQYFFELALVSNKPDSLFNLALNGGEGKYGFLDIVVASTRHDPYYIGRMIQFFKNNGGNSFTDVTDQYGSTHYAYGGQWNNPNLN